MGAFKRYAHATLVEADAVVRCADRSAWLFERPAPFVGPPTRKDLDRQQLIAFYGGIQWDQSQTRAMLAARAVKDRC